MVTMTLSDACRDGQHKWCDVRRAALPGVLGGWECSCECHLSKEEPADDEPDA